MNYPGADAYHEEAAELLAGLESSLLELERTPADAALVGTVFRALHTIKGSGAMFGFDEVAAFTHQVETVFDLVREGRLSVTHDLINLALASRDHIRGLLAGEDASGGEDILRGLREVTAAGQGEARQAAPPAAPAGATQTATPWRIRFTPSRECLFNGTNPLLLLRELAELGESRVTARTTALPTLETMDPELCYLGWDLELRTTRGLDAIRDVFIFVEGDAEIVIEPVTAAAKGTADVEEAATPTPAMAGPAERMDDALASIRVPAGRLDALVNIVGELVTVQARLTQLGIRSGDPETVFVAEELERLTEQLRDNTMSIRTLPIGAIFSRFRRLVRDLSAELGKEVELTMDGGETGLDKTVIEKLHDPLVHLIRNSMDHGIGTPAAREAAGKPRQGRIRLAAVHSGAHVVITMSDDGRGLDRAAILSRAVERGLAEPDAVLSDEEVFALILQPGFSTAREVTSVSGRGVGMDVVKRSIEALRGSMRLASTPGEGTTITLRLPLTLAIIDGLLVRSGAEQFVLPLANILECIELGPADQGHLVVVRDEPVGCIRLREFFGCAGERPVREHAVITDTVHGKYGVVVDVVVGDHQTVIKPLTGPCRRAEVISGATILGDGTVALVVDADKLAAAALAASRAGRERRRSE